MIKVFSTQYLAENPENKNDIFILNVKDVFFLGMRVKHEEHCNYDLSLIERYRPQIQPKTKKIGFVTSSKSTKKRKKNEDKSKTN